MTFDLTILQMASGMGQHANARLSLIARNIANADTPGYRAQDLPAFEQVWRAGNRGALRDNGAAQSGRGAEFGAMSPNGNDVALEDQMMRASAVRQDHELALGIWSKSLDILRSAIGRRG